VLIAGDRLVHFNLATGRTLATRLLPAPATDLAVAPGGGTIAVATLRGAALLDRTKLDVLWHEDLGIVDAVELAPDGRHAYLLLHPGTDPHEAAADHTLLEIAVPDGAHGRAAILPARAYDLLLDAPAGAIFATDLIGRTVHRIDLATFAVTTHEIALGRSPEEEPRGAFLRVLLPGRRPGEIFALEDLRARARLWRWEPAADRLSAHELAAVDPPVLGGGPLGAGLWLFTRREMLRLSADLHIEARTDLAGAGADSAAYRFAAADLETAVFLGPEPPAGGRAQSRITWIDLRPNARRNAPGGVRLLELRAGPLALLPRAEAAAAAVPGR
jgi:hypothetical protein